MELLYTFGGIIALSVILSIPAWRFQKRTGKKLGRGAGAAILDTANMLFQPSAQNAAEFREEQKEMRTAIPAGEDKDFANKKITIRIPDETK
ncbi:MAG: hypothetical protein ACKOWN_00615 [Microbacteriaceae bacterium]